MWIPGWLFHNARNPTKFSPSTFMTWMTSFTRSPNQISTWPRQGKARKRNRNRKTKIKRKRFKKKMEGKWWLKEILTHGTISKRSYLFSYVERNTREFRMVTVVSIFAVCLNELLLLYIKTGTFCFTQHSCFEF